MIGCGNHRENPVNDCERTPKLNIKDIVLVFLTKYFMFPLPIKSPAIRDEFKYNDYM